MTEKKDEEHVAAEEAAMAGAKEMEEPDALEYEEITDGAYADDLEAADPLEAEIAALAEERDVLKDKLMRALAEAENTRRRAERDRKDAEAFGGTKLARDLLTVHDNMDRALAAAASAAAPGEEGEAEGDPAAALSGLIEGVQLTRRELLAAFAKHKIEPVKPEAGDKFDPNLHQAMFEAPVPGAETGAIIEVMQTGFTISGRLLRPALVGVAKAAG